MIFMLKDFYIHNSKLSGMAELTLNLGFIKFMEAIFHWEIVDSLETKQIEAIHLTLKPLF